MCLAAPLEFRNSRLMSQIFFPFQFITRRGLSVTTATGTAFRFSVAASSRNRAASFASTTTAIRS